MFTPATIVSAVAAISFAAGLNVYATILGMGLMARLHWVTLPSGLNGLTNSWVIGACALLYMAEFFADKIPAFDLVWNAAHTFVRLPVAALLAYQATSHLSPLQQAAATALGAAIATASHGSKFAARALVTPSPEPVSNIALSSGEDAAAFGLTWGAMAHPVIAGVSAAALTLVGVVTIVVSFHLLGRMFTALGSKLWWTSKPVSGDPMRSGSSSTV